MTAPFDRAAWLRDFTAAGGTYFVAGDHLHTTTSFVRTTREQQHEACRLVMVLSDHPELVGDMIEAIEARTAA